jgi:hypothetical protein
MLMLSGTTVVIYRSWWAEWALSNRPSLFKFASSQDLDEQVRSCLGAGEYQWQMCLHQLHCEVIKLAFSKQ